MVFVMILNQGPNILKDSMALLAGFMVDILFLGITMVFCNKAK